MKRKKQVVTALLCDTDRVAQECGRADGLVGKYGATHIDRAGKYLFGQRLSECAHGYGSESAHGELSGFGKDKEP